MRGARGESAFLTVAGIAAVVAYYTRFPYLALLVAGAVVGFIAGLRLLLILHRGQAWHQQDVLIRRLWTAARRIPSGYLLTDPETGELVQVERERGWLTLAVADAPGADGPAVVTRYMVGQWSAPVSPPLYRYLSASADIPPARWRLREQARVAILHAQTGALEVTAPELAILAEQVCRTCALGQPA
jgi:hypothetical protein